ncbi:monofunctional biosynthetic peptidoglycan transglycosylase [Roseivivax sp. GX 12232]|uniref:monofunctional biosynthetic peptidoglycan transglycosylase n=1 Tax=Roseivivax sp. GX 12232 TaxID=2900547 RepID=UPI001E2A2AAE|nr:monofunctional biosynthetic peptidoglycan transglycosylase [Roseivivax sp. GX 12232]MCE0505701.1 monofunctional biosynthetic peptidoglycan transglycosylase [Roseivivax sp. GX 12232]
MAKKSSKPKTKTKPARLRPGRLLLRWGLRGVLALAVILALAVGLYRIVPPPTTPYIIAEARRLDGVARDWVPAERIAPVMLRAAVAAEDANFCRHWGFDMTAIRDAIEEGGNRGASTISQQVVKNVYLWHGRSWSRKALEAVITPAIEAVWPKRRILEVYLNIAEFDEGVFGVEAAARHYFSVSAADLSPTQAARLAAILPDPKGRSAADPSGAVRRRAASILDGAATIERDGRAACFGAA